MIGEIVNSVNHKTKDAGVHSGHPPIVKRLDHALREKSDGESQQQINRSGGPVVDLHAAVDDGDQTFHTGFVKI